MKADFHVHSIYSPDSLSRPADLMEKAHALGLGKLIITDHNTIAGALEFQKSAPDFVIVGEEIKTKGGGEVLAIFVSELVPRDLTPEETFARLHEQGAFISMSHPYAFGRYGWTEEQMMRYRDQFDAIEICNARNPKLLNNPAVNFAEEHNIPGTAGSDSHGVKELGAMGLELPEFNTAEELRAVIRQGKVFGKESSAFVRVYSRAGAFAEKFHLKRY